MVSTIKSLGIVVVASLIFSVFLLSSLVFFDAVSPLPQRDAWSFIAKYVTDWQYNDLTGFIAMLFNKRAISDHAVPLYKILFLLNIKFFGLDFRIDGIVGFIALSVLAIIPSLYISRFDILATLKNGKLIFALLAFVLLMSPISHEIYSWSLPMFGHIYFLLGFIGNIFVWLYISGRVQFLMFAAGAGLSFMLADDSTMSIAMLTQIIIFTLMFAKKQIGVTFVRKNIFKACSFLIVLFLAIFLYSTGSFLFTTNDVSSTKTSYKLVENLWLNLHAIFTGGIINRENFAFVWMRGYIDLFLILFMLVGLATVIRSLIVNGIQNFAQYIGIFFILSSLIAIALILIFRPSETLVTPRYGAILQKIPFGILWFLIDCPQSFKIKNWTIGLFLRVAIFILLIISYSGNMLGAYKVVPYSNMWYGELSRWIIKSYENPNQESPCIAPAQGLCDMDSKLRHKVLNYLSENKLNLFNDSFQNRYGPFPFSTGLKGVRVISWGPSGSTFGVIPNATPDGKMGIWIVLSKAERLFGLTAKFGSLPVELINNGNGTLTAAVDINTLCKDPEPSLKLVDQDNMIDLEVGKFSCESYLKDTPKPVMQFKGLKGISVVSWGPKAAADGIIPNPTSDGKMGIWVVLSRADELVGITARYGNLPVELVNNGNGILTAAVDVNSLCNQHDPAFRLVDPSNRIDLKVGKFNCVNYFKKYSKTQQPNKSK